MTFTKAVVENLKLQHETATDLGKQLKAMSYAEKCSLHRDFLACGIECDPPAVPKTETAAA